MSASNSSNIPSGNAAKASSVGANTVNVPSPERVSTNPAASRAATKVLKPPATAISAIDCCSSFASTASSISGTNTASITWITPFEASMSVDVTCASFTNTFPSTTSIATFDPCSVSASSSVTTCSAITTSPAT